MKPAFSALYMGYPKSEMRKDLYDQIGWSNVVDNPSFQDTCAIRMSIALLSAGVSIIGANMAIKAGSLAGRRVQTGQGRLSHALKRIRGKPEVYEGEDAAKEGIGRRRGVVSFFRLRHFGIPTNGGHIDLVYSAGDNFRRCARACYFDAAEVWFWPLN